MNGTNNKIVVSMFYVCHFVRGASLFVVISESGQMYIRLYVDGIH